MDMTTIDMKATGERLKSLCDDKGLAVKDLQKLLGLASCQGCYKWIRGKGLPSIDHLFMLASILEITVDDIIITLPDHTQNRG